MTAYAEGRHDFRSEREGKGRAHDESKANDMPTIDGIHETTPIISEAIAAALIRLAHDQAAGNDARSLTIAWHTLTKRLEHSKLTPRQRELVLLDMLGLRRAQIADVMGVTPATLTSYWKAIYDRYDLHGADARAALHAQLFPR